MEPAHTRAASHIGLLSLWPTEGHEGPGPAGSMGTQASGNSGGEPSGTGREQEGLRQRRCPPQRGGPPAPELVGQLVQDLHGLSVVVQLRVHQGRELAHLLDLWDQQGWRDTTMVAVSLLTPMLQPEQGPRFGECSSLLAVGRLLPAALCSPEAMWPPSSFR